LGHAQDSGTHLRNAAARSKHQHIGANRNLYASKFQPTLFCGCRRELKSAQLISHALDGVKDFDRVSRIILP
jgi:hypothetical protein